MKAIISIGIWLGSGLLTILLFFVVFVLNILLFPFDKKKKITHAQCFWWSDAVISLNPYWSVKVSGLENIDHKKTYVVISNHQSMADIVVLYQTKMQFKWVAKASLFKVPFIGWCLGLIKHIRLLRGDFASIKEIYHQASQWLRKDVSVLFFPEGTRSSSDKMNEFQNGAFKLAIKEKKPILPICLIGTCEAIPKGSWIFKTKVLVKLIVLPAVETDGFGPGDFALLRDTVRAKIESAALGYVNK
ncbi:MAG: 1-acyl-sn-glycerol-3-phosphate acyltransferase [Candidatus Omnitrophica bacterium]|jgi:1-acyl-sn-glycerol-3-phosphate acyltransferase|nr:1-acyl-sn-glycerol-3-phosphate acyltransferase [Candidatus Omnitrophota bacterium]MDD5252327.1 lysophospholipid acyltransferase family protein [Candidatus Omnitrophota bacterium]